MGYSLVYRAKPNKYTVMEVSASELMKLFGKEGLGPVRCDFPISYIQITRRKQCIVGSLYAVYTTAILQCFWRCRTGSKLCTLMAKLEIVVWNRP